MFRSVNVVLATFFSILIFSSSLFAQPTFSKHTIEGNLSGAYWVFTIDVDSDGDIDMVTASNNGIDWWENNGSESFTKHFLGSLQGAWGSHADDIDKDGDIDILGCSPAVDKTLLFRNNGNESFTTIVIDDSGMDPERAFTVDLDGDGDKDILVTLWEDGDLVWYENKGSSFPKHTLDGNISGAHSIYAADFDGDGDMDVVGSGSGKTRWYRNSGSGSFTAITIDSDGGWSVFAADIDGDGDQDILRTQRNNGDVDWYENNGSGSFSEHNIAEDYGECWAAVAADIDGDGDLDVAGAGFGANNISVWLNQGGGSFGSAIVLDEVSLPRAVHINDIDGDGDGDVAAAIRGDRDLVWYEVDGVPSGPGSITVTKPNGGESIPAESEYQVTWSSSGSFSNVKIELSTNGGGSWSTVASSTNNDGSYNWSVPNASATNCLIRISDASDGSPVDVSNGTFAITSSGGSGSTFTFAPAHDARVRETSPNSKYGTKSTLAVDKGEYETYLKFNVSGLTGSVTSAVLRMTVDNSSDDGGTIYGASNNFSGSNNAWTEEELTFNNRPVLQTGALSNSGDVSSGEIAEWDVTSFVTGSGTFSFGMVSQSTDKAEYFSHEGNPGPQLVVTTGSGSGPTQYALATSVDGSGQVSLSPSGGIYDANTVVQVTATPSNGWVFDSWSSDLSGNSNPASLTMTSNKIVTAKFVQSTTQYQLSTNVTGSGQISLNPSGGTYDENTVVLVSATAANGWSFNGWSGDLSGSATPSSITMNSDKFVTASFVQNGGGNDNYIFLPSEDGQIKVADASSNYGMKSTTKVELEEFVSYFKFDVSGLSSAVQNATLRLYCTGSSVDGGDVYQVSNYYKNSTTPWDEDVLTAGNAPGPAGNPIANLGEVTEDNFVEVNVSSVLVGNGSFSFAIRSTTSDQAKYYTKEGSNPPQLIITTGSGGGGTQYTLMVSTSGQGTVTASPSGGVYDANTVVQLTATAASGWEFTGWSGGLTGSTNPANITMSSNKNVVATFTETNAGGGGSGTTLTFNPTDDAKVKSSSPTKSYDGDNDLRLRDGDPAYTSFLKFNISGVSGSVTLAKLRLYVEDDGPDGGTIYSVSNNYNGSSTAWDENDLVWDNAPVISGQALDEVGEVEGGSWAEFDLTGAISGNGVYSFALKNSSTNSVIFSARETANPPELVVTTGSGGNTSPVAQDDNASTITGISTVINVLENDFDPDGSLDVGSVTIISQPQNGTVLVNPYSGLVTYEPDNGFIGTDSFIYEVSDDAGSFGSASVAVEVNALSGTLTKSFQPTEDGQVKVTNADESYGDKTTMKVEESAFRSFMKFNVTEVSGSVQRATLRLYVVANSDDAGEIYMVSNDFQTSQTPWQESTLTAENAPQLPAIPVAAIGEITTGTFIEIDVTGAISGDGIYSFAIASQSSDQGRFDTKEGENPPVLEVEFADQEAGAESVSVLKAGREPGLLPDKVTLSQNYPNPFNAGTTIEYTLPATAHVQIAIYNLRGQLVATLSDGVQEAGFRKAYWHGKNDAGQDVGSGIYFVRLAIGDSRLVRKITLQK